MTTGEHESFPEDRSILDRLRREHRGTPNLAFAALSLSDEPVEVRQQFLREYSELLQQTSEDPEIIANPHSAACSQIAYACVSSSEKGQRYLEAWKEADPAISHPVFGDQIPSAEQASSLGSTAEVVNESRGRPELDPLKTKIETLEAQGFLVRTHQGVVEGGGGYGYEYKAIVLGEVEISEVKEKFREYGEELTDITIKWDHVKDRSEVYDGEDAEDALKGAIKNFFGS